MKRRRASAQTPKHPKPTALKSASGYHTLIQRRVWKRWKMIRENSCILHFMDFGVHQGHRVDGVHSGMTVWNHHGLHSFTQSILLHTHILYFVSQSISDHVTKLLLLQDHHPNDDGSNLLHNDISLCLLYPSSIQHKNVLQSEKSRSIPQSDPMQNDIFQ